MYKVTQFGVIRESDGANIPSDQRNSDYAEFVRFCQEKDLWDSESGPIIDNNLVKDGVSRPLSEIKEQAKNEVDAAAGRARAKYITTAPGQEMIYLLKSQQALQCVNDPNPTDQKYPLVTADAAAYSVTLVEAAQAIVNIQSQWLAIGSAIERIRLAAKNEIDGKLKESTVEAAKNAAIQSLTSI